MLLESAGMCICEWYSNCRGLLWRVVVCLSAGWVLASQAIAATDPYSLTRPGPGYDVQTLLIRAEQGDKRAAFLLGSRYAAGRETTRDDSEALRWFTQAAQAGLAEAQFNLGIMYASGRGVPRNIKQAIDWYTRAAQQGLAMAQFNLGTLYSAGVDVPRDEAKAADWLERAANKGLGQAQFNLGILYEFGRGVRLNADQALYWYRKAETESAYAPAAARRRRLERLLKVPEGGQVELASTTSSSGSRTGTRQASEPEPTPELEAVSEPEAKSESEPASEPESKSKPEAASESESVSRASQNQDTVETAKGPDTVSAAAESEPAVASANGNWLASLDDEHYTLQLASYVDRTAAEKYIRSLEISSRGGIYASTKRGKRWYSIIYGDYASYQQAQAATRSLPDSFRGIKPWVRKVLLIRKEME